MQPKIKSPVTNSLNTIVLLEIEKKEIIEIYKNEIGVDVEKEFSGLTTIQKVRCLDSSFEFYYPYSTEGSRAFYESLGKKPWYYNPSRWEHTKVLEYINDSDKVLEVGAGYGDFLVKLKNKGIDALGLELNEDAKIEGKKRGVVIQNEFVQDHALLNKKKYDVLCSFQVLEHVAKPIEFLESQIECLKEGGKLIIGVPNNDSYLGTSVHFSRVLNMPPHHMGLWSPRSMKYLENIFPIDLKSISFEPLVGGNIDLYLWNKMAKLSFGSQLLPRILWKLRMQYILRLIVRPFSNRIKGNSMLVVFQKR